MCTFRELMEAFPNAKVVLTVRRPETWYTSVSSTIHRGVKMLKTDFAVWLFSQLRRGGQKRMRMLEAIAYTPFAGMDKGRRAHSVGSNPVGPPSPFNVKHVAHSDISGFFEVIDEGPEASEEYYKKWVENVKATVPKERLLVFDVKQVRTVLVKK